MKTRKVFFPALALVAVLLLAFLLRGAVQEWIILPLARFIWLVKGYYGAFPQAAYWVAALGIAALVAIFGFRYPDWEGRRQYGQWTPLPGPVREMAFWIQRGRGGIYPKWHTTHLLHLPYTPEPGRGGIYPKWHTAHLLAKLALDILDQRGTRHKHAQQISGPGWDPPENVKKYLDAALTTNYTDYPKPGWFSHQPPTPFDQDLEPVIKYLESLLESEHDYHS
jgi:hypothetical protein